MKPQPRRGRPPTGKARSAAERMRQMRARRKAAGFRMEERWVREQDAVDNRTYIWSDHRLHDIRSLAMHALIARRISRQPQLLDRARDNLRRWRTRFGTDTPRWWQEWHRLLRRPWNEVAATMTDPGEHAARLRQSTPFAGVLTPAERRRLHEAFRA